MKCFYFIACCPYHTIEFNNELYNLCLKNKYHTISLTMRTQIGVASQDGKLEEIKYCP